MRLLLVEDEPDVAETLTWGLGADGYVVDTADNGVTASDGRARQNPSGRPQPPDNSGISPRRTP